MPGWVAEQLRELWGLIPEGWVRNDEPNPNPKTQEPFAQCEFPALAVCRAQGGMSNGCFCSRWIIGSDTIIISLGLRAALAGSPRACTSEMEGQELQYSQSGNAPGAFS